MQGAGGHEHGIARADVSLLREIEHRAVADRLSQSSGAGAGLDAGDECGVGCGVEHIPRLGLAELPAPSN